MGSQGIGRVTHVDTEILQNYYQSRLGKSAGEPQTEASRNGGRRSREREIEGGKAQEFLQMEKVHPVEPGGPKLKGCQERRKLFYLERCRAMLGGTKCRKYLREPPGKWCQREEASFSGGRR